MTQEKHSDDYEPYSAEQLRYPPVMRILQKSTSEKCKNYANIIHLGA